MKKMHFENNQDYIFEASIDFSKNILGPIFYDYCHRLHTHFLAYEDCDATFLFCTRAGLRLKYLYELFLEMQDLQPPKNEIKIFWISRFMVAKGLYLRCPDSIFSLIANQFSHTKIANILPCLLPKYIVEEQEIDITLEFSSEFLNSAPTMSLVRQIFRSMGNYGKVLQNHFSQQSKLFEKQVQVLLKNSLIGVLVDSGWNATTQKLLMEGYPEIDWNGCYFGRFGDKSSHNWHFFNVIGLIVEAYDYDPQIPESCLHFHHHLIEDLLEPILPSVEYLRYDEQTDTILPDPACLQVNYQDAQDGELHYCGVLEYFKARKSAENIYSIRSQSKKSWRILHNKICFPSKQDVAILDVRARSADFGKKDEKNPILIYYPRTSDEQSIEIRLQRSLWKQGQMALEFSSQIREKQEELLLKYKLISKSNAKKNQIISYENDCVRVAIITRTKNRPVMLKRAALSVAKQTFNDWVWVVVNDGGDIQEVNDVVACSPVDLRKVIVLHNQISLGMEAASNKGILASQSAYVVIHDDDDTWQPQFLEKTVAFLDAPPVESMCGVIAHANRLSEFIVNDAYVEVINSVPYQDWVMTVSLYEMLSMNMFAPISFLFSRKVYEQIGGFDESLPVLGDWDFNIRFLMQRDIGVIPEMLANYHHRDLQKSGSYSNSIYGSISKHQMFETIIRNRGMRHLSNQSLTAQNLLGLGRATYDIRAMIQKI